MSERSRKRRGNASPDLGKGGVDLKSRRRIFISPVESIFLPKGTVCVVLSIFVFYTLLKVIYHLFYSEVSYNKQTFSKEMEVFCFNTDL